MTTTAVPARHRLAEEPAHYAAQAAKAGEAGPPPFAEATLTALWLLGRIPPPILAAALPSALLRPGRAGRGPGPDVREAAFLAPSGATVAGDVEVHLRATDFVRHGHAADPAYAGVVLHLCWQDDRPDAGAPTVLPGGGAAPTVALAGSLVPAEVERLVALGPDLAVVTPPCAGPARRPGPGGVAAGRAAHAVRTVHAVRDEGRGRLAERTWRAWRLADRYGFDGALTTLLDRAVASSAGRRRESEAQRAATVAAIHGALGDDPVAALAARATVHPARAGRAALTEAMRAGSLGAARAGEVAWNVALPLLAALSAAYDDVSLARATAALAEDWPAPRPYGRTRALDTALGRAGGAEASEPAAPAPATTPRTSTSHGALYAQGLLHLQDLWCSRGGCGVCPLSAPRPGG